MRLNAREELRFQAQASKLLTEQERKDVMEIVTSWMEAGLRKGLKEGRHEGRQEGRQFTLQEDILDILQARFDSVPEPVRERVQALRNDTELKRLLRQAALVPTLAAFSAQLAEVKD